MCKVAQPTREIITPTHEGITPTWSDRTNTKQQHQHEAIAPTWKITTLTPNHNTNVCKHKAQTKREKQKKNVKKTITNKNNKQSWEKKEFMLFL